MGTKTKRAIRCRSFWGLENWILFYLARILLEVEIISSEVNYFIGCIFNKFNRLNN